MNRLSLTPVEPNRRCSHCVDINAEEKDSKSSSPQLLQMDINQLTDSQENVDRH